MTAAENVVLRAQRNAGCSASMRLRLIAAENGVQSFVVAEVHGASMRLRLIAAENVSTEITERRLYMLQ